MRKLVYGVLVFVFCFSINAQTEKPFDAFKDAVRTHWAKGEQTKSIELLENKKDFYRKDSEQHTILYYLGLLYLETDNYKKSFEAFNAGFERKLFFSLGQSYTDKIKSNPKGKAILQTNENNRANYLKTSSVQFEVILPENYDEKREYPLLYFLHGNNSNLEFLKTEWKNVELATDAIVILAQSPYARSNYAFDWIENPSSKKRIDELHKKISTKYPIDKTKVIVGGFSNGGRMAIGLFLDQAFPICGFLVFNPSKPNSFKPSKLNQFGKGAIITGEKDYMLAKQISMANTFFELSTPLRLVVLPNHGHNYPKLFSKEINESIKFLIGN